MLDYTKLQFTAIPYLLDLQTTSGIFTKGCDLRQRPVCQSVSVNIVIEACQIAGYGTRKSLKSNNPNFAANTVSMIQKQFHSFFP